MRRNKTRDTLVQLEDSQFIHEMKMCGFLLQQNLHSFKPSSLSCIRAEELFSSAHSISITILSNTKTNLVVCFTLITIFYVRHSFISVNIIIFSIFVFFFQCLTIFFLNLGSHYLKSLYINLRISFGFGFNYFFFVVSLIYSHSIVLTNLKTFEFSFHRFTCLHGILISILFMWCIKM